MLVLDADATVAGYWSDGTANVEIAMSLRNEGDLRLDHAVEIIVTCSRHGDVINGCGSKSSLALPGGFGPASDTLTLRVPTGDVSLTVTYGERGTETLDLNVPERILGVDRDVWECFSDTSKAGTIWEDDEGIGCGAWSGDPLQKWDQTSPLKVFIKGPDGFVVEFKDVLNDLSPVVNLQFEWVDAEYHADVSAYIGLTVPALESQGVYCLNLEAFGCANTEATRGEVVRGEIIVFNLWPDQGVEFGDFGDRRRADFRSAMIHEAVHALARMSHRTELLSMMNQAVSHKAELSPMDEALLRLQGYELVKPGMTMADIGSQIVFNDELMDPQPVDPRFASWWFVSNAYRELRDATSASFRVRSSFPGCSEEFGWADYEVGNLTGHHPYFGWVKIDDGENHVYTLQPYSGQLERWKQSESGWFEIRRDEFSDAMPGWRGDLSDPHHLLESILYYGDWADAELSIHPRGQVTLRTKLDTVRGHAPSSMERVEVVLIIDGETYAILEYSMEWKLGGDTCDTYEVQARAGQYSVEFAFPDEVRQGSRFLDSCDVESLGPLEGYVRRSGHWARECGLGRTVGGYSRSYRFSLDYWAFVRLELASDDEVDITLFKEDGSGTSIVDLDAAGSIVGGPLVPDEGRLRWAQLPLSAGEYTAEVVTLNRVLPGNFTFTATGQPTPPPPYRFKSISVSGWRACGLLLDGTPICWGKRNVEGDGSETPGGKFASIRTVNHTCALQEDGTPACWDFKDEGEHTCESQNGGIFCSLNNQPQPDSTPRDRDLGDVSSRYVGVIVGYYVQTPPAGEKFVSIGVGGAHTCGLREDGTAVCWGSNRHGQSSPPGSEQFVSIDVGYSHTCGLRGDGTVVCWGADWNGLLSVPEDERFVAINAGSEHSCGLREDGKTVCWGDGGLESCGLHGCSRFGTEDFVPPLPPDGERFSSLSSAYPHCALRPDGSAACWSNYPPGGLVPPPEAERFTSISASSQNACALRTDGTAVCWGDDRFGQSSPPSGANMTGHSEESPPTGLVSISAGASQTCALNADGEAICWGPNWWKGRFVDRFATIDSGWAHACGLRTDGTVVCRGSNDMGQSSPPQNERFVSISIGPAARHTCGLREDGIAVCWGNNESGQSSPPPDEKFVSISSGSLHTCGLRTDGTAVCWGKNTEGEDAPPEDEVFVSISSGSSHTCGLRLDGTAVCWVMDRGDQLSPPVGERFVSISGGGRHVCALRMDGAPVCWGENGHGQASPPTGKAFVAISSGAFHSCGLRADGTALCWGRDNTGQASPCR